MIMCVEGLYSTIPYLGTRVSVPSSELASSAPSPASECVPLGTKGGATLADEGGANSDEGTEAWHSVYSVIMCNIFPIH
jgi:hypothetical protein